MLAFQEEKQIQERSKRRKQQQQQMYTNLFGRHGNVLLGGVGVVLICVQHDDRVGQRVRRVSVSQAVVVTIQWTEVVVVVVYHVTIVAIGHGLLKKFWPLVLGCVLRTAGSSII